MKFENIEQVKKIIDRLSALTYLHEIFDKIDKAEIKDRDIVEHIAYILVQLGGNHYDNVKNTLRAEIDKQMTAERENLNKM